MNPTLSGTLDYMRACYGAVQFARGKTLEDAWKRCGRPDWMTWLLDRAVKARAKGWPKRKAFTEAVFRAIEDRWEGFCPQYYLARDHVFGKKKLSPARIERLRRFFARQTPNYTRRRGSAEYRRLCIVLTDLCWKIPRISAETLGLIVNPNFVLGTKSAAEIRRYLSPGPYDELVKKVWRRS